jgi:hypothetical protein
VGSSDKDKGASGTKTIIAPLPCNDVAELPYALVAKNLAITSSPRSKLYGDAVNVSSGIEQEAELTITESVPSQSVKSWAQTPSDLRMKTVYAVIVRPLSVGGVKVTITLDSNTDVTGASGVDGKVAHKIVLIVE